MNKFSRQFLKGICRSLVGRSERGVHRVMRRGLKDLVAITPPIRGVMYRGQCMGCGLNTINLNWKLIDRLNERGVFFEASKPRGKP